MDKSEKFICLCETFEQRNRILIERNEIKCGSFSNVFYRNNLYNEGLGRHQPQKYFLVCVQQLTSYS